MTTTSRDQWGGRQLYESNGCAKSWFPMCFVTFGVRVPDEHSFSLSWTIFFQYKHRYAYSSTGSAAHVAATPPAERMRLNRTIIGFAVLVHRGERNVSDNRLRTIERVGRNTVRKPDPANRMVEGVGQCASPMALRVDVGGYSRDLKRKCKTTKLHRPIRCKCFYLNTFLRGERIHGSKLDIRRCDISTFRIVTAVFAEPSREKLRLRDGR